MGYAKKKKELASKLLSSSNERTIKKGVRMMSKANKGFKGDDENLKEKREYKGKPPY